MNIRPSRTLPDPATAVLTFLDPFDKGALEPLAVDALAPGLHPIVFVDPLADDDVVVEVTREAHAAARSTMRLEFSSLQAVYGRTDDDERHAGYRTQSRKRTRRR